MLPNDCGEPRGRTSDTAYHNVNPSPFSNKATHHLPPHDSVTCTSSGQMQFNPSSKPSSSSSDPRLESVTDPRHNMTVTHYIEEVVGVRSQNQRSSGQLQEHRRHVAESPTPVQTAVQYRSMPISARARPIQGAKAIRFYPFMDP